MPEQSPSFQTSIRHGHEVSTISAGGVVKFLFLFFVPATIAVHVGIYYLLGYNVRNQKRLEPPPFPLGVEHATTLPQPLQPGIAHNLLPWQDLPLLRSQELQALRTGGPLPDDPAHVHIPIDRAMQLFLQRGGLHPATQPTTRPEQIDTRPATVENRT
jgi:hypothetical protein